MKESRNPFPEESDQKMEGYKETVFNLPTSTMIVKNGKLSNL